MEERQLDLFDDHAEPAPAPVPAPAQDAPSPVEALSDNELVARLRGARLAEAGALYAEVRRRSLAAAVPLLCEIWHRHIGFGRGAQPVRDQVEVICTLASIDCSEAASVLRHILGLESFPPSLLEDALRAAADKRLRLPSDLLTAWTDHNDSAVRALACRLVAYCAPPDRGLLLPVLENAFADGTRPQARRAAAVTLGGFGRLLVKDFLLDCLAQDPDEEVIGALGHIADRADDVIVRLRQLAMQHPEFRKQIAGILEDLDSELAKTALRQIAGERRPD